MKIRNDIRVVLTIALICLGVSGVSEGGEADKLIQDLILNRYESQEQRVALLEHIAAPQMRERIERRSLNIEGVMRALHSREFNREMIGEFKEKGWVGEDRQGLLEVPPSAGKAMVERDRTLVREVLNEENQSRELIIKLLTVFQEEKGSIAETAQTRRQFATLLRQQAQPGEWIQQEDGRWIQK